MTAADELKAFKIDPRFAVNLFAGEEQSAHLQHGHRHGHEENKK